MIGEYRPNLYSIVKHRDGRLGFNIFQRFKPDNCDKDVLVNRGWVPIEKEENTKTEILKEQKQQKVTGILKKSEHFEVKESQQKQFRKSELLQFVDLQTIGKLSEDQINENFYIEEFISDSERIDKIYPVKSSRNTYIAPYLTPRKHIEYSVFWGLSTLCGMYGIVKSFKIR